MRRSRNSRQSNSALGSSAGGGGNGIVGAMQRIAEVEARKMHIAELAVVTSVFPHSTDSDVDNYECNIRLKDKDVELRKVPVATQHIGLVNIPHVGDLVIVTFINGDVNSPIIIGRLYNDADRPPTSKEEEIVYKPPYAEKKSLRRININLPKDVVSIDLHDDRISAIAGKSSISANSDGEIGIRSIMDAKTGHGSTTSFDNKSMVLDVKGGGGGCVIKLDGQGITIDTDMAIVINSKGNTSIHSNGNIAVSCAGDYSLSANNITMNSKATTKVEVGASLDVTAATAKLEATGGPLSIKSSATANVESTGPLSIKSNATASMESVGPLSIKSSATANVEAAGPMTIRGAVVNVN